MIWSASEELVVVLPPPPPGPGDLSHPPKTPSARTVTASCLIMQSCPPEGILGGRGEAIVKMLLRNCEAANSTQHTARIPPCPPGGATAAVLLGAECCVLKKKALRWEGLPLRVYAQAISFRSS